MPLLDSELRQEFPVFEGDGVGSFDVNLLGEVQGQLLGPLVLNDDAVLLGDEVLEVRVAFARVRPALEVPGGEKNRTHSPADTGMTK